MMTSRKTMITEPEVLFDRSSGHVHVVVPFEKKAPK